MKLRDRGQWPESNTGFSTEMMTGARVFRTHLLWLCLVVFKDQCVCCHYDGSLPLKPNISHLKNFSDEQSLVVSWMGSHGSLESNVYEIQISRTEKYNIIYSSNVSASAGDSGEHTWTWFSDLPLECIDHSVRIRSFCNQTAPSPWSNWKTNYGAKAKDKTLMFPHQKDLKEGATVMFCCVPTARVNITRITFGGNQFPLLSVGARVKAISVENLTVPAAEPIRARLLKCTESTGQEVYTLKFIRFPPQKPRNLNCATSDMKAVTCSWDSGREQSFSDHKRQTHTLHIENSDQAPITCQASPCSFPAVPQLQEYSIRLVVKHQLGEVMETYSFNITDRVLPVLDWDTVNPEVTDVILSWRVHGNLTQTNLLCQAEINAGSIRELICNSVNGRCKVKLEHLHPNTHYSTRVRCSVNGRLWGEWTRPQMFSTVPLVTLDLWRRIQHLSDSDSRLVTLLWNPHVFGRASKVTIKGYKVDWTQEGQISTELKDSGQNQAEVFVGPGKCEVSVQAVLPTGSSVPSSIVIPPKDDTDIVPLKRQRLSSASGGGFNLSWDEQSSVTCGYTVEWCILGGTAPCTLQWIKMPEGNNTLFLPASRFKAGCRYSFNVYGCSENGHTLLETQTGYSQELRYVASPSLIELVQITSSSVTLEWRYDEEDPAQLAFITGYLVTVQEVGPNTTGQAANLFNVSVGNPHQKSVTIEGLQQQHEYTCSVSALTKEGAGLSASILVRTRSNYSSHLAKILTPILLLLGCMVLLWPRRKTLNKVLREIFTYPTGMNIKTLEFESFLYETDQRLQTLRVEECISCDIEVLDSKPEMIRLKVPDLTNPLNSPDSYVPPPSPSCQPVETEYRPQAPTLLDDDPTQQQVTNITNRSYLSTTAENHSEPQEATLGQISFDPSECLQESCIVVYGYISKA